MTIKIINGISKKSNSALALAEIRDLLNIDSPNIVMLFISNKYDFSLLGKKIKELFGNTQVIACSTAGEISAEGYSEHSISGFSLKSDHYLIKNIFIKKLSELNIDDLSLYQQQIKSFTDNYKTKKNYKAFSTILIDGLSVKEETVLGLLDTVLQGIPLAGGSAGDGLRFIETFVYYEGKFYKNAACLTLFATDLPFKIFKSQHFSKTESKLVITEAIPEERIVTEINGEPAAEAYAKILGVDIEKFDAMVFSKYPLMLNVGGEFYVRSIQKVNADKSLTFYCAIDVGLVLTLATKENILNSIQENFDNIKKDINELEGCLLFECILRQLEISDMPEVDKKKIFSIYAENKSIGFHTYGEQFGPLHINQTLTGVAFGK